MNNVYRFLLSYECLLGKTCKGFYSANYLYNHAGIIHKRAAQQGAEADLALRPGVKAPRVFVGVLLYTEPTVAQSARRLSARPLDAGKESMNTPKTKYIGDPRRFCELPQRTQLICNALTEKLINALQDTVLGIYLYGAVIFPESDHIVDIDSHVILKNSLSEMEKNEVKRVHKVLVDSYEHLTEDDLDIWYLLLGDLHLPAPSHQVIPNLYDTAWALHRAHMLAGYCIALYGPEPPSVFSAPTWSELAISLENERKSIMKLSKRYPAYCVLNACRLMYSYTTKDVVISKKAAAQWAIDRFHAWEEVINASIRWYAEDKKDSDKLLLESQTEPFLIISERTIENCKHK